MEMEMGIVTFFEKNKLFGFAAFEKGKGKIFFHLNDVGNIVAGENEPVFSATISFKELPKENDYIVFRRSSDSRGRLKAAPWGFADDYLQALEEIESRPIYRLIGQYRMQKTEKHSEPEVLWQGSNITNCKSIVSAFYKRIDGFNARCWFEKQQEDGNWKRCEDPRSDSRNTQQKLLPLPLSSIPLPYHQNA